MTRKKNTVAARRWRSEVDPIREFAKSNRGFTTALVKRLERRFRDPRKNWRVMLGDWLSGRAEPLAGTGIVLLDEARELMEEWTK
jgi:hypothetical protein